MLSALSFLDMLLQFRTGYVDKKSKIVIDPKKVQYGMTNEGGVVVASPPFATVGSIICSRDSSEP